MTSVQQFAKLPHRYGNSHATQCYLPPGRGDIPAPLPRPKLVLDLATPEGCKAELTQLAGCIPRWHTRPKTVTHPSTNRARRWLTSFMRRTPLTQICVLFSNYQENHNTRGCHSSSRMFKFVLRLFYRFLSRSRRHQSLLFAIKICSVCAAKIACLRIANFTLTAA